MCCADFLLFDIVDLHLRIFDEKLRQAVRAPGRHARGAGQMTGWTTVGLRMLQRRHAKADRSRPL